MQMTKSAAKEAEKIKVRVACLVKRLFMVDSRLPLAAPSVRPQWLLLR
jgi:hypothetical protein